MGERFFKFPVLPGVHTENSLVIKRVVMRRNPKLSDGIRFRFVFFPLQLAFKRNISAKLAGKDICFEGGVKGIEGLFQFINNA